MITNPAKGTTPGQAEMSRQVHAGLSREEHAGFYQRRAQASTRASLWQLWLLSFLLAFVLLLLAQFSLLFLLFFKQAPLFPHILAFLLLLLFQ